MRTLKIFLIIPLLATLPACTATTKYPPKIESFIKQATQQFICGKPDSLLAKVYANSQTSIAVLSYKQKEFFIGSSEGTDYVFIKGTWKDANNITDSEKKKSERPLPTKQEIEKESEMIHSCIEANLRSRKLP